MGHRRIVWGVLYAAALSAAFLLLPSDAAAREPVTSRVPVLVKTGAGPTAHPGFPEAAGRWGKLISAPGVKSASVVKETADGGLVFDGETDSWGSGQRDFWIFKLDSAGSQAWAYTIGDASDNGGASQATDDGGYIVNGFTSGGMGAVTPWIMKLDSNAAITWQKSYNLGFSFGATGLAVSKILTDGYILSGLSMDLGTSSIVFNLVKIDLSGNILWQKSYGAANKMINGGSVSRLADGSLVVGGMITDMGTQDSDFYLMKLTSGGDLVWAKTYGGPQQEVGGTGVFLTGDGGFFIFGQTKSWGMGGTVNGVGDLWALKLDSSGGIQWQKAYGGTGDDTGSILPDPAGGYIIGATTTSWGAGGQDIWFAKLDTNGAITLQKTYGGPGDDYGSVLPNPSGPGYLISASTNSFGHGAEDEWAAKLDASGNISWQYVYGTSIDESGATYWTLPSGDLLVEGYTRNPTPPDVTNQDFWAIRADSNGSLGTSCPFIQTGTAVVGTASGVATTTDATPVSLTVTVGNPGYTTGTNSLIRTAINVSPTDLCSGVPNPLTASASADHTSGTAPLSVQFTGSAAGGTAPYTYDWDFGDGTGHSTAQSPSHTYNAAGGYPVTLTVHDSVAGTATDTHLTIAVSAAGALLATAAADVTSGTAPLTVNFTGSASGGTGPYTYLWDFGDGGASPQQSPSHTYLTMGGYSVTFTVHDSASHMNYDGLVINVSAPGTGNILTWSAPAPGGLNPPQNLQVSATQGAVRETVLSEIEPNGCITLVGGSDAPQMLHPGDTVNGSVEDTDSGGCLQDSDTGDPIEDLFGLTITQSGTYTFTLSFDSGADLDLYLVTTDLQTLNPVCGFATCGITCDNPETFQLDLDPGTYVLGVNLATVVACDYAASADYSLSVTGGSADPVLQGYDVYRATVDSDPSYSKINGALLPTSPTSYTDTTPPPGTVYYRVKAVYDQGESGFSNTATVGGITPPSGAPWAWGYNSSGQVGDGSTTDRLSPVSVSGLSGVTAFEGGQAFTLALKSDGTVFSWGDNFSGQLGNGTYTGSSVPVQVSSLTDVTAIAAGSSHSLARKSDGTVWAWGYNYYGQLGGGGATSNVPLQVAGLSDVTAVAAGSDHSMALKSDGTVWVWGSNYYGQLGQGTSGSGTNSSVPLQVSGLTGVTAIAGGYYHSLALKSDGTVWAWGYNYNGQLGDGTTTLRTTPTQVPGLSNISAISAGYAGSLALKGDGTVWAWGWNGASGETHVPAQISFPATASQVVCGYLFAMVRLSDGNVWSWGRNTHGQLGDGTTTWHDNPVQVVSPGYVVSIAAGDFHAQAIVGTPPCTLICTASAPGTGTTGASVSFTATATPTACLGVPTFAWTFGDGGTSSQQNPSHTYAAAGNYTWALTVSADDQVCTHGGTITVSDAPPPLQASSSSDKTSGTSPLAVGFTGSATGGVPPYSYAWAFGDGGTSTQQSPSHTFTQVGSFTAVLTVTDSASSSAQATGITITVTAPLSASASVNTPSGNVPLAVSFSGSASGGTGPYTYDWNFGDGTAHSSSQNPAHTYATAGNFTVTLTVTDSASRTATDSHLVIHAVSVPPPVIGLIKKAGAPFRLIVTGSNLQSGIRVFINGSEWTNVQWKNTGKIKVLGGKSLKTVVPKGVTAEFRFLNPDGGETTMNWSY